jgi:hypothetical protein
MTDGDFRHLALLLAGVEERSHMGHPDFRANGKIFATLDYPNHEWGMVKLSPEQQNDFIREHGEVFVPVKGAWGRKGSTNVRLEKAEPDILEKALRLAHAATVARPGKKAGGAKRSQS